MAITQSPGCICVRVAELGFLQRRGRRLLDRARSARCRSADRGRRPWPRSPRRHRRRRARPRSCVASSTTWLLVRMRPRLVDDEAGAGADDSRSRRRGVLRPAAARLPKKRRKNSSPPNRWTSPVGASPWCAMLTTMGLWVARDGPERRRVDRPGDRRGFIGGATIGWAVDDGRHVDAARQSPSRWRARPPKSALRRTRSSFASTSCPILVGRLAASVSISRWVSRRSRSPSRSPTVMLISVRRPKSSKYRPGSTVNPVPGISRRSSCVS